MKKRNTVYSTDSNEMERIREMARKMQRPQKVISLPPEKQVAHLHREKKGRGGKTVIVVQNLVLSVEDGKALCKHLKKKLGCGGSFKEGVLEIQGDRRYDVAAVLIKLGYQTKNVGG